MTDKSNIALKKHKTFIGVVTSNTNDKTITVNVETAKTNPIYHKRYKATKKYHAHDQDNIAMVGDVVEIIESRPLSALKRFKLLKVITKAETNTNASTSGETK